MGPLPLPPPLLNGMLELWEAGVIRCGRGALPGPCSARDGFLVLLFEVLD